MEAIEEYYLRSAISYITCHVCALVIAVCEENLPDRPV